MIARGDAGNDTLIGGAGRDDLDGRRDRWLEGGTTVSRSALDQLDAADGQDIDGGPGDDTIGRARHGGSATQGPDTISGGGGNDTVDFSQRTQPLTISLDGVADDGEADERDNVLPDVEGVIGGSARRHADRVERGQLPRRP